MFLIRMAFWLGLVVLVLPTDERQQARLYETAAFAVERATTFCDRNAGTCAMGSELWASFLKKAEFGARMAFDLVVNRGAGKDDDATRAQPASNKPRTDAKAEKKPQPAQRGTLTPTDLNPPWRGQPQRTGA